MRDEYLTDSIPSEINLIYRLVVFQRIGYISRPNITNQIHFQTDELEGSILFDSFGYNWGAFVSYYIVDNNSKYQYQ